MTPAFLLTFMKGFLLGRVFGKNNLSIDLEKEDVDLEEHRQYLAKLLSEKASEMQKIASKIASGDEDLSFFDAATLTAEEEG
jgi:recombinational DNA repair protein RecR